MSNPKTFLLATRPNFLLITLLGCFIGLAIPGNTYTSNSFLSALAICITLFAHAGANLLNDYCDHRNGSDENNSERISPYTGGSRFIQNKILSAQQVHTFAWTLLFLTITLGLYICSQTTWALLPIGLIGVLMAWGYSSAPLQLMSRGIWGVIAIALAWSTVVVGMASLKLGQFADNAIPVSMAFGFMLANVLLVNQIPDINADKAAGKITIAVKYRSTSVWAWYLLISLSAYALQLISILDGSIPSLSLITLTCIPGFIYCAILLHGDLNKGGQLKLAIQVNLLIVHFYAILLWIGMLLQK